VAVATLLMAPAATGLLWKHRAHWLFVIEDFQRSLVDFSAERAGPIPMAALIARVRPAVVEPAQQTAPAPVETAEAGAPSPSPGKKRLTKSALAWKACERGRASLASGDSAGAIEAYKEALSRIPRYPAGYRGLGLAYAQQGRRTDAVRYLRLYLRVAGRAPDRREISNRIGQLTRR
jgi:tetratricopeptide (TPR) repeat protein